MTRIGVTGSPWRATVTPWGRIDPEDGRASIDWFIGATDRLHVPEHDPTVRQRRIDGTPVVETRVRVPGGDAVHVVAVVADGGGHTVIEVRNESSSPFAVAFTCADLVSSTAPSTVAVAGLPADAVSFPVAHRSTRIVTLAHRADARVSTPFPPVDDVVKGWRRQADRGSRYELPLLADELTQARCELMLDGPLAFADPIDRLLAAGEWVRLGERPHPIVDAVAHDASTVARENVASPSARASWAFASAAEVLRAAGEDRAARDAERLTTGDDPAHGPTGVAHGPAIFASLRARLVAATPGGLNLLPRSLPSWIGEPVAVYDEPTRWGLLSFAVRWHGERPALLWELATAADPIITCGLDPSWSGSGPRGEALLHALARG